jgi:hypothetical protein
MVQGGRTLALGGTGREHANQQHRREFDKRRAEFLYRTNF